MATYRILYWQEFPAQIEAKEDEVKVKVQLPDRFMERIDAKAMARGMVGTDAYLEAWQWGEYMSRAGPAKEAAESLLGEIEAAFPA